MRDAAGTADRIAAQDPSADGMDDAIDLDQARLEPRRPAGPRITGSRRVKPLGHRPSPPLSPGTRMSALLPEPAP